MKQRLKALYAKALTNILANKPMYVFLGLAMVLVYFRWFSFNIYSYGDWNYKYVENLLGYLQLSTWVSAVDFGAVNELVWRAPYDFLYGVFAFLHLGMNVSEKLLAFWPLAVTSVVAPYILVYELTKNKAASIAASIFYATNTYFLAINPQGHILLPLAANWLTIAFAVYLKALRLDNMRLYLLSALILWIASITDFRLFYIGAFLFAVYTLYKIAYLKQKVNLAKLAIFGTVVILTQLSWLLAMPAIQASGDSNSVFTRSLFGGAYWNLSSAIALYHPFWTDTSTTWFIVNDVPIYFYALPVIACMALIAVRKNPYVLFFGAVAIIGILLSKQTNEPFAWLYPLLFDKLPGFNAFREATKFYYLVLLGYTVLIGIYLTHLHKRKSQHLLYGSLILVVLTVGFINTKPYITGSIQKLFTPRTIPADYAVIADKLKNDKEFYRTLWVPIASRWGMYDANHPRTNIASFIRLPIYEQKTGNVPQITSEADIQRVIGSPFFDDYLRTSSVKYVFVPLRDTANQDNFFRFYGDDRQLYIDLLSQQTYLERTDFGTKDVVVFKNKQYEPRIMALSNINALSPDTTPFAAQQFFGTDKLGSDNFIYDDEKAAGKPAAKVQDPFSALTSSEVKQSAVTKRVRYDEPGNLYIKDTVPDITYEIKGQTLSLLAYYRQDITIDGKTVKAADRKTELGKITIRSDRNYFLSTNDGLQPLDMRRATRNFGPIDGTVKLLSMSKKDQLISNGSFEKGAWDKEPKDCNPHDANAKLTMAVVEGESTEGNNHLEFESLAHTACSGSEKVKVASGDQYVLSFDYKAPFAERIAYGLLYDNAPNQTVNLLSSSGSNEWRKQYGLVTVPAGATNLALQLRGLPMPDMDNTPVTALTAYDNVRLARATQELSTKAPAGQAMTEMPIQPRREYTIQYNDRAISPNNLITNGSLESGPWKETLDICDQFQGVPKTSMATSSKASNGEASLEISTDSRTVCTGPDAVDVREGDSYLLTFDYQADVTKAASFNVSFNNEERANVSSTLEAGKDWKRHTQIIRVPTGANKLSLKVYARSSIASPQKVTNRYDNFNLQRVANVQGAMFYRQTRPKLRQPADVSYASRLNRHDINVKAANGPFYLKLGEAFHGGWQLSVDSGDSGTDKHAAVVPKANHLRLNDQMNGWYIDPEALCKVNQPGCSRNSDGSVDMRLVAEFKPQQAFNKGLAISVVTLVLVLAYVTVGYRIRFVRHRKYVHISRR